MKRRGGRRMISHSAPVEILDAEAGEKGSVGAQTSIQIYTSRLARERALVWPAWVRFRCDSR